MITRRCDGCRSYVPADGGAGHGFCHFLPPSQFRDVRNEMYTPFPTVRDNWWCAQHEANTGPDLTQADTRIPPPEDDF